MKKAMRFLALTVALGLTSWLALGDRALAVAPCYLKHGAACLNQAFTTCGSGGVCVCSSSGTWDCGCIYDDVGTLICPGDPN